MVVRCEETVVMLHNALAIRTNYIVQEQESP